MHPYKPLRTRTKSGFFISTFRGDSRIKGETACINKNGMIDVLEQYDINGQELEGHWKYVKKFGGRSWLDWFTYA